MDHHTVADLAITRGKVRPTAPARGSETSPAMTRPVRQSTRPASLFHFIPKAVIRSPATAGHSPFARPRAMGNDSPHCSPRTLTCVVVPGVLNPSCRNSCHAVRLFGKHGLPERVPTMVADEKWFAMSADDECFRFAVPAEDYAGECMRLAALSDNQEVREHLFELAGRRMVDVGQARPRQLDNVIPLPVPRR